MGSFAVGDILLARFPFSDLSHAKLRPVVVVSLAEFDNFIVAQITSQTPDEKSSIRISKTDIIGKDVLRKDSYIRTTKLFTTDATLIVRKLGRLSPALKQRLYAQYLIIFAPLNEQQ